MDTVSFRAAAVVFAGAVFAAVGLAGAPAARAEEKPGLVARPDLFETLVNPSCSHLVDEVKRRPQDLKPEERVLAWIRGYSDGGGIPYRLFFSKYPVISDTYGVFACDPDAGFVQAFEPSLDFAFHGWRNGVLVMRQEDGTLYSCLTGIAFDGPGKGKRLKPVPFIATTWGYWFRAYPHAVTYQLFEKYQLAELPRERTREPSLASRAAARPELPAEEPVFGLELGGAARAYPMAELERSGGVLTDRLGDREVVVLCYAPTRTAAAYAPRTEDEGSTKVTLEHDGSDPIAPYRDVETSSWWGIEGRARSGPLTGKTLEWLPGVQCKWFAWCAEHPGTEVWRPKRGTSP
ncbi:MAG: DUF3179 domain-containing protein [Planctomycetes bacterium]|nr:DUF3179 domain-containing protein [Planctomycetota bacterium]